MRPKARFDVSGGLPMGFHAKTHMMAANQRKLFQNK